jgi:hypothetical protein
VKLLELHPQFMRYDGPSPDGKTYLRHVDAIGEANGIDFLCPKCFVAIGGCAAHFFVTNGDIIGC